MSGNVLEVEQLTKRFGSFTAVSELSFSIGQGDVVGFLGQNGAGKSTTIKVLCNLIRPTSGEVRLNGRSIFDTRSASHRRKLGAIVEAPRFYPHLSGYRNLALLARVYGVDGERVHQLMRQVGLGERGRELFGRFSMGMKQRLGLAAVLINDPTLVILDEPTTGLDPVGRQQIHDLIRDMAQLHGASIFLSSHMLTEVSALCGRALVLHQGRLLLDQSLADKADIQHVQAEFSRIAAELTAQGVVQ